MARSYLPSTLCILLLEVTAYDVNEQVGAPPQSNNNGVS